MDVNIRNEIMVNHEHLIKAVIKQNTHRLNALRIEADDAYQELSIALLKSLKAYETLRSVSLAAYIRSQLQYAMLDMKKRCKPCGITEAGRNRVVFASVSYDYGSAFDSPYVLR